MPASKIWLMILMPCKLRRQFSYGLLRRQDISILGCNIEKADSMRYGRPVEYGILWDHHPVVKRKSIYHGCPDAATRCTTRQKHRINTQIHQITCQRGTKECAWMIFRNENVSFPGRDLLNKYITLERNSCNSGQLIRKPTSVTPPLGRHVRINYR